MLFEVAITVFYRRMYKERRKTLSIATKVRHEINSTNTVNVEFRHIKNVDRFEIDAEILNGGHCSGNEIGDAYENLEHQFNIDDFRANVDYPAGEDFECNKNNQRINNNLNCTIFEAMLQIYSFYLRHNISWAALEDIAHLGNIILGSTSILTTKHIFKKMFAIDNTHILEIQ